jgi:hypothetical protein
MRYMAMMEYQKRLPTTIKSLTDTLITNAYKAQFDDDAKRVKFKEQLVKLAQLSEEEALKLDVSKRP